MFHSFLSALPDMSGLERQPNAAFPKIHKEEMVGDPGIDVPSDRLRTIYN
jgi:hypothetical protein